MYLYIEDRVAKTTQTRKLRDGESVSAPYKARLYVADKYQGKRKPTFDAPAPYGDLHVRIQEHFEYTGVCYDEVHAHLDPA